MWTLSKILDYGLSLIRRKVFRLNSGYGQGCNFRASECGQRLKALLRMAKAPKKMCPHSLWSVFRCSAEKKVTSLLKKLKKNPSSRAVWSM